MGLYPLKFKPLFIEKMWGGRKLQTVLGKSLPPDKPIGESWELYDFPPGVIDQSGRWISAEVANGPLAGQSLHALLEEFGAQLHGDVPLLPPHGQFPLLIKFLDAREDLSVQVHPDQAYARQHPGAHLKNEAWYVLEHSAGARLLKGLRNGASQDAMRAAIQNGSVESLINSVSVKPGECFYLPSGTVHALGAGILVAEIQTPSDATFRLFDFNRVDPGTGKPRTLHVEEALACIDFTGKPQARQTRSHVAGFFTTVTRLVTSDDFKIEKVRMSEGVQEAVPYDEPVVWIVLEGTAEVRVDDLPQPVRFARGDTVLLPAVMKNPVIQTTADCQWLEVTIPARSGAI
jgi:mannose-6-phosphate isomerase